MNKILYLIIVLFTISGCSQKDDNYMKIIQCLTTESGQTYTAKDVAAVGYKTVEMMDRIARSSNEQTIKNFALNENGYLLPDEFCKKHKCKGPGYLMYKKIRANPEAYNWYRRYIYTVIPSHEYLETIHKHCDLNRKNIKEVAIILVHKALLGEIFMKEFSEQYQYLEDGPKIPK
jgi:hypothetical protein